MLSSPKVTTHISFVPKTAVLDEQMQSVLKCLLESQSNDWMSPFCRLGIIRCFCIDTDKDDKCTNGSGALVFLNKFRLRYHQKPNIFTYSIFPLSKTIRRNLVISKLQKKKKPEGDV